jgi:iron complex transport system substrate-binding protein
VLGSLVGGTNAFADLDAQWTESSWDAIAERNPDVLVVADLSRGLDGDSAADKISFLESDAVASQLSAVVENRILSVPAAELDPSVRSVGAATELSEELVTLFGDN